MGSSSSRRSRSASTTAAEPHDPEPRDPYAQDAYVLEAQSDPVSLDPRLWPRPYVDQPAEGPQTGPMRRMPRFTPALPAAQADASPAAPAAARPEAPAPSGRRPIPLPAGQPAGLPVRRPPVPADALPPGRPGAPGGPGGPAAPPAGRAPEPPPPVSRDGRPQPVRAVIGDEIRIPFIWCEFGTCDATYTHPDALGELDLRARALAAGWRYDALGRRGCPDCAQHDPTFWTARRPAPVGGDWRRAG